MQHSGDAELYKRLNSKVKAIVNGGAAKHGLSPEEVELMSKYQHTPTVVQAQKLQKEGKLVLKTPVSTQDDVKVEKKYNSRRLLIEQECEEEDGFELSDHSYCDSDEELEFVDVLDSSKSISTVFDLTQCDEHESSFEHYVEHLGRSEYPTDEVVMTPVLGMQPKVRTVQSGKLPERDIVTGKRTIALIDSGLDHVHLCGDIDMFEPCSMKNLHDATRVIMGNSTAQRVTMSGDILLWQGQREHSVLLKGVLYVPGVKGLLLSMHMLMNADPNSDQTCK